MSEFASINTYTVDRIRSLVALYDRKKPLTTDEALSTGYEIQELWKALDEALSNGGELPEPWRWTTDDRIAVTLG